MPKIKTPTKVHVSLALFDQCHGRQLFRLKRRGVPIGDFAALTLSDYKPEGMTPLRDATMEMIGHLDKVQEECADDVVIGLLVDESGSMTDNRESVVRGVNDFVAGMNAVDSVDPEAGGKVLCVIVTDGKENASRQVSQAELAAATAEREARGWTFIYLGANQDAWEEGSWQVGVSGRATGQTVGYASTPVGTTSALASVTQDASDYLTDNKGYARKRGQSANRTVSESGAETVREDVPQPEPPPVEPYGDVDEALRRARGR